MSILLNFLSVLLTAFATPFSVSKLAETDIVSIP